MNPQNTPIAECDLTMEEKIMLEFLLSMLDKKLGLPGDWGRETQLGSLTIQVKQVLANIKATH